VNQLKPCPFCGGKAKLHGSEICAYVWCTECACETTSHNSREAALKAKLPLSAWKAMKATIGYDSERASWNTDYRRGKGGGWAPTPQAGDGLAKSGQSPARRSNLVTSMKFHSS
jgi:hypothetical protein